MVCRAVQTALRALKVCPLCGVLTLPQNYGRYREGCRVGGVGFRLGIRRGGLRRLSWCYCERMWATGRSMSSLLTWRES